ncbi:PP2C family serine/threonine-protein phosphatase [Luteolibacter soli]|uniref:PP2C family serine/threonine-protein phosphatase n=1 Tax=Luteolibacter soli TaxID=3135280 RepID=A0ABU9AU46_9BACT
MSSPGWRFAGASVAGTSHERTGTPCQDSHLAELIGMDDSVLVLIASDGAGSASHSHLGSSIACQLLMDELKFAFEEGLDVSRITKDLALYWLAEIQAALHEAATAACLDVREFACTLLAAIISPTHAAFLQVGDGAIVVRHQSDSWSYVFWPQHGQFINTTHFITEPTAHEVLDFDMIETRIDEAAAFTDGIESLVLQFDTQTVHAPFFDGIFGPVRRLGSSGPSEPLATGLGRYLAMPHVCEKTDDDKTLVLATRIAVPLADSTPASQNPHHE